MLRLVWIFGVILFGKKLHFVVQNTYNNTTHDVDKCLIHNDWYLDTLEGK